MDRAGALTFLDVRYGAYLLQVGRDDSEGDLGFILDEALQYLSVPEADIATWSSETTAGDQDMRVMLAYRFMLQVVRDLGPTQFDVSIDGEGSFKLSQIRAAAERDLALAESAVRQRFRTLGIVPNAEDGIANPFVTLDHNFLTEDPWVVAESIS